MKNADDRSGGADAAMQSSLVIWSVLGRSKQWPVQDDSALMLEH